MQSIAHFKIPREKRKVKKEKKKKVKEKGENKKGLGYACCSACVAGIATSLLAAQTIASVLERCTSGIEGWAPLLCTTELLSSISPKAKGGTKPKRSEAKKPLAMSF